MHDASVLGVSLVSILFYDLSAQPLIFFTYIIYSACVHGNVWSPCTPVSIHSASNLEYNRSDSKE